jgi:putative transposase
MARPMRIEFAGALYHITARGNEKRDIFNDEKDFNKFIEILKKYVERFGVKIYCYVLMNNHYHLMVETPGANLTAFMHNVQSYYTNYFNKRHKRIGHLFQGRYKALIVDKDSYLMELSRYIHLNPVRAGLVARPERWKWSSYRNYISLSNSGNDWISTRETLRYFGNKNKTARKKYAEYVVSKADEDEGGIFDGISAQLILGSEEFVEKVKRLISGDKSNMDREIIAGRELAGWSKRDAEKAVDIISGMFAVNRAELLNKGGYKNRPRDAAIAIFHRYSRWRNCEIGEMFSISGDAVVKKVARFTSMAKKDQQMMKITGQFLSLFAV